jgi:hypothetical protein
VVVLDVQADRLIHTLAFAFALALAACAVDDQLPPAPHVAASADERRIATQLREHLAAVPGVAGASVIVHVPPRDPFARAPSPAAPAARAAIVLATRPGADAALLGDAAIAAGRAVLGPAADVQVQIAPPPPRAPALVRVGPFRVTPASRAPLIALLATALAAIAALSTALAVALYRRGINPHQSSASTTRGS